MKKSIFDRRIPTVFALLVLLGGLAVASFLIQQGIFTVSQASPEEEPKNVQIVNVTDSSFTLVFTTGIPTTAAVNIQNTNPPTLVYDKRDTSGKTSFLTHFITVNSLNPDTTYDFSILSNGKNYLDQGKLYTVKTLADTLQAADTYPLAGSVLLTDGNAGSDTLLLFTIPEALPVAAVTDPQGNFRIAANIIRNAKTQSPLSLTAGTPIEIAAIQKDATSNVTYSYIPGELIPAITLTQNYSFIASEEEAVSTDEASLLALPTKRAGSTGLSIISPKSNQTYTDSRPQFRGSAAPNSTIRIVINTNPSIEAQIKSDSQGNWAFRPNAAIAPGKHTITAYQTSPTAQRSASFEIFASGSQIAESATPSAAITPTRIVTQPPTVTVTPVISISQTVSPSTSPAATPTVTVLSPIITATPIPTATPTIFQISVTTTPQKQLPPTGDNTLPIILTTLSIIFIVTGSAFLFML